MIWLPLTYKLINHPQDAEVDVPSNGIRDTPSLKEPANVFVFVMLRHSSQANSLGNDAQHLITN